MANPACVAIGINRYQFFQPLSYARADAEALRLFLVEQAGWSSDRCLLLTEASPPIRNRSTYPSRENLIDWVDNFVRESVQSGDLLWFFFSGYGVNIRGEDYLMPLEGKPDDISTGISVRSLFERLKQRGDAPVLVLLDINRSQAPQANYRVGHQTVELAKQLGIPVVLSGQLDELSYEAAKLGHGLFTAGLLEILGYTQAMTLAGLDRDLRERVPELSQNHKRPVQTPLTTLSSLDAGKRLIFAYKHQLSGEILNADSLNTSSRANPSTATPDGTTASLAANGAQTQTKQAALVPAFSTNGKPTLANDQTTWQQNLLLWGSGLALVVLMIAGVLLRNRDALIGQQGLERSTNATATNSIANSQLSIQNSQALRRESLSTTQNSKIPNFSQSQQQSSQEVLNKARTLIVPNQASQFSQAIAQASKIPQKDPLYNQAQQDIARWSGVILDLAKGRAQKRNFLGAIAAAQLVPSDQPIYKESQQAIAQWQDLAKQQQTNQDLLQTAKGLINPAQASSYNKAITAVSKIPREQPDYTEAQQLIAKWSQTIYQMAQYRASKGKFQEAIQTANLVPPKTPDYEAAQKAIALWKAKTKK